MKKGQYHSKTAVCPFYKKEDSHLIYCSGLLPNTSIHLAFGNSVEGKKFKIDKCRKNYLSCPIYKMLEAEDE